MNQDRSSSFRATVKANSERGPDILLQRAGQEMPTRLRWENRSWLPRLREGFEGLVGIPGRMLKSSIERAISFLLMAFSIVWQRGKKLGGYQLLWEEELPDGTTIRKIRIPHLRRDEDPWTVVEAARGWLSAASLAYVAHDNHGAYLVVVMGAGSWLDFWQQKGLVVKARPTTAKRLKLLTSPKALIGHLKELRVQVLEAPGEEKLFDGLFYIRKSIVDRLIRDCKLGKAGRKRASRCRLFNARLLYADGLLKGNCMIVEDDLFDQLHGHDVDVVSHVANLKKEIRVGEGFHLGLEPQPPEMVVRTNLQQMLSLPQLFRPAEVLQWAKAWIRKVVSTICRGELLDTVESLTSLLKEEEPTSLLYLARWTAYQFLSRDWSFEHSPSLVNNLFDAHTRSILGRKKDDLTVPVPCAWRMQILSASAAGMGGWLGTVERGHIRITSDFAVVHDEDWLEMLPSHGGCDLDDHFCLYFRFIAGVRRVVVIRDPSDLGEYSVFTWTAGDPFPVDELHVENANGEFQVVETSWPKADLTGAPERISEAVAGKRVKVGKLPEAPHEETPADYTPQAVLNDVKRVLSGTSPGFYVNARMLQNMLCPQHGKELFASMEDVIDTCTKGGNEQALQAVGEAARAVLSAALELQLPIDETFWKSRGFRPDRRDRAPKLVKGWWSKLLEEVDAEITRARTWMRARAQEWHAAGGIPAPVAYFGFMDEGIYQRMVAILKAIRKETVVISAKAKTDPGFDRTAAMSEMYARYRLVVGEMLPEFAYVAHTVPTVLSKEISEPMLFSKSWFADYMEVLGTPLDEETRRLFEA